MAAVDGAVHGADRVAASDARGGDRALDARRVTDPRAPERAEQGDARGGGDHDQLFVVPPEPGTGTGHRRDRGRETRLGQQASTLASARNRHLVPH